IQPLFQCWVVLALGHLLLDHLPFLLIHMTIRLGGSNDCLHHGLAVAVCLFLRQLVQGASRCGVSLFLLLPLVIGLIGHASQRHHPDEAGDPAEYDTTTSASNEKAQSPSAEGGGSTTHPVDTAGPGADRLTGWMPITLFIQ